VSTQRAPCIQAPPPPNFWYHMGRLHSLDTPQLENATTCTLLVTLHMKTYRKLQRLYAHPTPPPSHPSPPGRQVASASCQAGGTRSSKHSTHYSRHPLLASLTQHTPCQSVGLCLIASATSSPLTDHYVHVPPWHITASRKTSPDPPPTHTANPPSPLTPSAYSPPGRPVASASCQAGGTRSSCPGARGAAVQGQACLHGWWP
jgi:hypothetical protein